MTQDETQENTLTHLVWAKPLFCMFWLVLAVLLYRKYGNADLFFPPVIFIWLLVGFAGFGILNKWRRWKFLLVPILAIVVCIPLTLLYWAYGNMIAEDALHDLIIAVADGDIPAKFSIDEDDLTCLAQSASHEYGVEGSDYFFGSYDWRVSFPDGSKYDIYMVQEKLGYWDVDASCYRACPSR